MRTTAYATEYAGRGLTSNLLVWITAKDRVTGDPESIGFFNGRRTLTFPVLDGVTGLEVNRDYIGSGALIEIGQIPLTSDISVRELEITLNQIDSSVEIAVRGFDARNAPVEVHEAMFDPATETLAAPAEPLFVGYVDRLTITTPAENQEGSIKLFCVSHTRELTRGNPQVKSGAWLRKRSPGDAFYDDVHVAHRWKVPWGLETASGGGSEG